MNINELIIREANSDSKHDEYYREALYRAFNRYKDMNADDLMIERRSASSRYKFDGSTHQNVADLVVTYALLQDKKG